jgi:sec-independent protein translocase protein TatA
MTTGILSPTHLLVVLVVALIVLGPKRLPGAGKALGQGLREFKDSISGAAVDHEPGQVPAITELLASSSSDAAMTQSPVRETAAAVPSSAAMTTGEPA